MSGKIDLMLSKGFLSVAAVCLRAGCSPGVVYRALETGELAGCQYLGQKFVSVTSLEKFLAQQPMRPVKKK